MNLARFFSRRNPVAAYCAVLPLVAATAWLLHKIQIALATVSPTGQVVLPRPFSIAFILLGALLTLWGGWGPGILVLLLALVVNIAFLLPNANFFSMAAMDWASLSVTLCAGLLIIGAVEAAQRARKRSAYLLAQSENAQARLRAVTDAAPVGVLTCDANGVLDYANPETERIWGQPLARVGLDGYDRYKIFSVDGSARPPEKRGLARVLSGENGVLVDEMLIEQPSGQRVRVQARSTRIVGENKATLGAVTILSDNTEQFEAEEALRVSEQRYRSLVDATAQVVWTNTPDGEMRGEQPGWAAITGQAFDDYQGYGWANAVHPDDAQPTLEAWQNSVRTQTPFVFEHRVRRPDGSYRWYSIRGVPVFDDNHQIKEWVGIHTDITEQRAAVRALQESEERFRATHDTSPNGFMVFEAVRCVTGEIDDVRVVYVNPAAETITQRAAPDLIGKLLLEEMPGNREAGLFDRYKRVTETGETEQWEFHYSHEAIDAWFFNTVTRIGDGFAVRFLDISARRRAEVERARLLSEAQKQATQESLLNRIGQAQRNSDNPDDVRRVAVSALGEALRADRCYFTLFDTDRGILRNLDGWQSGGLSTHAGEYRSADFVASVSALFNEAAPVAVADVAADARFVENVPAFTAHAVRAFIAVPLFENGKLVAALNVAQSTPRDWTTSDIELVARAAAQTRTATDLALLRQRDHNIAQRLENALRPTLPEHVPFFDTAYHYQAALAESSIGGDFFDVFLLKNCIAFVIGDLSGKGLAAASQIATVRNMLRFSIYRSETIADALTHLNDAVVDHELLTGFATLFVGVYDPDTQNLSYGSCGHEPVFVRRAQTGRCDQLPATGPVMGGFSGVPYGEEQTRLFPGDTLVLYTDGLSEAGRARHEFLDTEGLQKLVEESPTSDATGLVKSIIEGVSAHARNVFHDDQCLVVARLLPLPEKIPASFS